MKPKEEAACVALTRGPRPIEGYTSPRGRVAFFSLWPKQQRLFSLFSLHSSMLCVAMAARPVSSTTSTCRPCLPAQVSASKPSTSSSPGTGVLVGVPRERGSSVSKAAIRGARLEAAARCSLVRQRPMLLATVAGRVLAVDCSLHVFYRWQSVWWNVSDVSEWCFLVSVGSLVAAGAANATEIGDSLVREHYVPSNFLSPSCWSQKISWCLYQVVILTCQIVLLRRNNCEL